MIDALHAICEKARWGHIRLRAPARPRMGRLILATTILASSLAFIDGSVVNVGLPAIAQNLDPLGHDLSWVVNAYLLPLSALLLVGGAAGDLYGRRSMLCTGIAIFALASLICAFAQSLPWLLLGRAVQGIGAALLMPNSLAILAENFQGEARGRAIGAWAAVGAGAGAIGPLIGGWLIDTIGWRAIFLINLPIAGAALLLAWRAVAEHRNPGRPRLDLLGASLVTLALVALTFGLTVASARHDLDAGVRVAFGVGILSMALFLLVEKRREAHAMMPLVLFQSRSFVGLTLLTFLLYAALGGLFVLVPYLLIESGGYSATGAGAALLPMPLVIALASPSMGRVAGKLGSRWLLTLGPLVVGGGFLLAMRMVDGGDYWRSVLPAMLVISLGMAAAVAPLTTAVLASVDVQQSGVASGLNSAVARAGGLVATALLGVVLAARGAELDHLFRWAVLIGAVVACSAGMTAFVSLSGIKPALDKS